jgi:hypothetical protein
MLLLLAMLPGVLMSGGAAAHCGCLPPVLPSRPSPM